MAVAATVSGTITTVRVGSGSQGMGFFLRFTAFGAFLGSFQVSFHHREFTGDLDNKLHAIQGHTLHTEVSTGTRTRTRTRTETLNPNKSHNKLAHARYSSPDKCCTMWWYSVQSNRKNTFKVIIKTAKGKIKIIKTPHAATAI